ncbi:MAG: hypothetical protein V4676_07205, partial [Bacteroidota bacterium]
MKTNVPSTRMLYALATTLIFTACQKTDVAETNDTSTAATIAVAASISGSTAVGTDSIYLMQSCGRGGSRDSIAQSALPATALAYIQANYPGSVFSKAFVVKNSSSAITGYVAIVYYSDNPVGLLFDNTGAFVRVLEQREKGDLNGAGHHRGGRFEHRDGKGRDSVALIALPATVTAWFAANFSTDTFADILSEARKYRLSLVVANQFIGQLTEEIRDAVFGNVGTM